MRTSAHQVVAGTPCLNQAAREPRTEQAARYARVLQMTATAKARGCKMIPVRIPDLEALIAIGATSDAAVPA